VFNILKISKHLRCRTWVASPSNVNFSPSTAISCEIVNRQWYDISKISVQHYYCVNKLGNPYYTSFGYNKIFVLRINAVNKVEKVMIIGMSLNQKVSRLNITSIKRKSIKPSLSSRNEIEERQSRIWYRN